MDLKSKKFLQTAESAETATSPFPIAAQIEENKENTPFIPNKVYNQLPRILRAGSELFNEPRERDVFLTGAIGVLSGCFPKVIGTYDGQVQHTPIYCFVVAPAASGKSVLKWAKKMGIKLHERIRETKKLSTGDEHGERLDNKFKTLFIPANASAAAIIQHLIESGGNGIVFETEADTLSITLNQDWGNSSDLLRKAFHNEPVSLSRKGEGGQYIEINKPKLAVALSGTPSQVKGLIPSSENGLLSRFLFYSFDQVQVWKDVGPGKYSNLDQEFDLLSDELLKIVDFTEQHPFTFDLSGHQWEELNEFFKDYLERVTKEYGPEAASLVKRMGCITFRVAMTLSVLKRYDDQNTSPQIICNDEIFSVALDLAKVYLEHGLSIFSALPQVQYAKNTRTNDLYQALPKGIFTTSEMLRIAESLGIPERTSVEYTKALVKNKLIRKIKHGEYEKL